MIVADALLPVCLLLILGGMLKRFGLTNDQYLKTSDRLVYYIFFPIMLFWKIGGNNQADSVNPTFLVITILLIVASFLLSLLFIVSRRVTPFQAGSFSQSCYRFNSYIGVAVILNSIGEEGIASFGVLISIAIPLINLFAVAVLLYYSQEKGHSLKKSSMTFFQALVSNPLILGCFSGLIYGRLFDGFPTFLDNSLQLLSIVTLPLALMSIGGNLHFKGVKDNFLPAFASSSVKLLFLPLAGFWCYHFWKVTGIEFKVGMIFLSLPTSTTIYLLSSQLGSDTELASSSIVISTLLSFLPLSVALLL